MPRPTPKYPLVLLVLLILLTSTLSLSLSLSLPTTNLTSDVLTYLSDPPHPPPPTTSGTLLPPGAFTRPPPPSSPTLHSRRQSIQRAVSHAWDAYYTHAFPQDELLPLSRSGSDTFSPNLGTTIVDSLSTLYLMDGLEGRYRTARDWVEKHLDFSTVGQVIVFETVIRILGGLVSIFHLSGDAMFLHKAEQLAVRLAASFDTPSGLPWPRCYLNETGRCESHKHMVDALYLAEVGSVQLEFRALSHHSGVGLVKRMRVVAERIIDHLQVAGSSAVRLQPPHEVLLPYAMMRTSGNYCTNLVTLGAPADSYFEYLVKVWVQGGRKEKRYWELVRGVVDSMVDIGTYRSKRGDVILRDLYPGSDGVLHFAHKMDHFACFIPGMVILAMDGLGPGEQERRGKWEQFAEEIGETCYKMYERSPSGLAGENVRLGSRDEWRMAGGYQLRPEAVEAFFYLWRYTRDEKWRRYAWNVFESIEKHCRVGGGGYAALKTAKARRPRKEDVMHSFLISETFKYLYLIFGEDDAELSLEHWVFNTEAHPLLITPALGERGGWGDVEQRDESKSKERDDVGIRGDGDTKEGATDMSSDARGAAQNDGAGAASDSGQDAEGRADVSAGTTAKDEL